MMKNEHHYTKSIAYTDTGKIENILNLTFYNFNINIQFKNIKT